MRFVSYAQNFEDVMLWRALKHIGNGFYIDIGAWSPDIDSVSKAFYDHGWRGINVDPNIQYFTQLCERRPRDTNLMLAVADTQGVRKMTFFPNTGLSTLDDKIAAGHGRAGWTASQEEVAVTTLASIWAQYIPPGQEVHFLKIDVEGSERAVLSGHDWEIGRPWIVLVEATRPMSGEEAYESWERILLASEYDFVYADGLNRFYVASEHRELHPAFRYPPNVFDQFITHAQHEAESRANAAEAQLQSIKNSLPWRISAPLRWARRKMLAWRNRIS